MKQNCLMLGLIVLASVGAADKADGASPFHDKPDSPRSLPGDNLPPFAMLDDDGHLIPTPDIPGSLLHRGRGAAPESSARGPSLRLAVDAARAAVSACLDGGYRTGVAVIDSVGDARALLTADGSDGSHVFVAMRKALTALAFKTASSAAHEAVTSDSKLLSRVSPAMFVEGGALPIVIGGEVIGAIGVSGAAGNPPGHQDEVCAKAGLDKIRSRLK